MKEGQTDDRRRILPSAFTHNGFHPKDEPKSQRGSFGNMENVGRKRQNLCELAQIKREKGRTRRRFQHRYQSNSEGEEMRVSNETEKKKKDKKKRESELENMIFQMMEKSLKKALDVALDDIFKTWK